jgi:hypothetical protein
VKRRAGDVSNAIAVVIAALVVVKLLVGPISSTYSCIDRGGTGVGQDSAPICGTTYEMIWSSAGSVGLLFISVPLILALLPFPFRRRPRAVLRMVAGVLTSVVVLLGAFSIGIYYVPIAVLMFASYAETLEHHAPAYAIPPPP